MNKEIVPPEAECSEPASVKQSFVRKHLGLLLPIALGLLLLLGGLITILVLNRPIPVDSLSLPQQELVLKVGQSAVPACIILPEDATERTLRWKSSNRSIATAADGVITGISEGSCLISVTAESGAKATLNVKVEEPIIETEKPVLGEWSLFAMVQSESIRYYYSIEPSLWIRENRSGELTYGELTFAIEDWRYGGQEAGYTVFSCTGDGLSTSFYYCQDGSSPYDRCLILPLTDGKTLIFHKNG